MGTCDCGDDVSAHRVCECGGLIHGDPRGRYPTHCDECVEQSERDAAWMRRQRCFESANAMDAAEGIR